DTAAELAKGGDTGSGGHLGVERAFKRRPVWRRDLVPLVGAVPPEQVAAHAQQRCQNGEQHAEPHGTRAPIMRGLVEHRAPELQFRAKEMQQALVHHRTGPSVDNEKMAGLRGARPTGTEARRVRRLVWMALRMQMRISFLGISQENT